MTPEQVESEYFILYYMFLKHAFGLEHCNDADEESVGVRIYLDQIPDTDEKANKFENYLAALSNYPQFRRSRVVINSQNIADVCSHDHDILQCLDIVLGSMQFRLNDLHKEIPKGQKRRGKRTRAKEKVYKHINGRLQALRPHFNIGASTGDDGDPANRWRHPYRHWLFVPKEHDIDTSRSKRAKRT
ncbi:hypothetical protein E6C67_00830 [Azospirillum sp. TSA2s]|uniref:hypothetical protein n=1 Tax=Azospirillum sp. TSA2s TaxID=709810 RepID=UPI0010C2ADB8|nr:hypothetical protein [Azospirillum sp. TSA2s]QCG92512.1 hypothetical protein E6C67_00830 [Azospirillum sp. TSA2s]